MNISTKILHIERQRSDYELVSKFLKEKGLDLEIFVVDNRADFIMAMEQFQPDIILSDDKQPTISAEDALVLCREHIPPVPLIVVSSNDSEEYADAILKAGAYDYFLKDRLQRLPVTIQYAVEMGKSVQSGKALKKQESIYKKLIEKSHDITTLVNAAGELLYGSPSIKTILGYETDEYLGKNVANWIHPEDNKIMEENVRDLLLRPGGSFFIQIRLKHKDGKYIWFEGTSTNHFQDDDINARVSNYREITERKETERKIAESEKRYRDLFDHNPMPMWIMEDETFRFLYVNQAAINNYGYTAEEFAAMTAFDIKPKEDHEKLIGITTVNKSKVYNKGIWHHVRKDGTIMVVEVHANTISYNGKNSHLTLTNDITDKINSEEALKKSEANLRSIFNSTNMAFILTDNALNIVSYNAIAKKWAYAAANVDLKPGISLISTISGERREEMIQTLNKALSGETISLESNYGHNGNEYYYAARFAPTFNDDGEVLGILVSVADITERKLTEKRLNQSEAHLLASQRIANVGSWEINVNDLGDLKSSTFFWSGQTYRIFGYEEAGIKISGTFLINNIHPDDFKKIRAEFFEALKDQSFYITDLRIVRKDGQIRVLHSIAEIIRDPETGRVLKITGTAHDITERKNAEIALKKSEANIRTIFENTETSFVLIDHDFKVVAFNLPAKKDFKRELGGDLKEGENTIDYFEGERRKKLAQNFQLVLKGKVLTYESDFMDKDGMLHWYFNKLSPLKDQDNNIQGMIMGRTEITEIKMSEIEKEKITSQLSQSEANLRTIFENTSISFLLLDPELKIISFNKRASRGFLSDVGLQLKEGNDMLGYFPESRRAGADGLFRKTLSGEFISIEINSVAIDGELKWYQYQCAPIFDENDKVFGILLSMSNITERKVFEIERENLTSEIVQRNKDLEQFAYIVSHNLRGSVANIIGTSAILEEENLREDEKKFVMAGLNTSVNKLENVITDLNTILQVKQQLNERKEVVSLSELVSDIQSTIEHIMAGEKITISTDFGENDEILTIKSYLHSVFYNLITNSIKYRKPDVPAVVEINGRRIDNGIQIVYKDNGLGMDLKKIGDQVFGLYKRFHANTEGKGMGLFMVKTQIESMGGKIAVKSELGNGCEFIITFKS